MTDSKSENQPATKGDVALVKGDIQLLKADLKELEQKLSGKIDSVETKVTRLEDITKSIARDVIKTQSDISAIQERMATRDDINRIMNAVDRFGAEAIAYRNQDMIRGNTIMDHTEKLTNHETRIQKLEAK